MAAMEMQPDWIGPALQRLDRMEALLADLTRRRAV
jgi:hypothetical protein